MRRCRRGLFEGAGPQGWLARVPAGCPGLAARPGGTQVVLSWVAVLQAAGKAVPIVLQAGFSSERALFWSAQLRFPPDVSFTAEDS